MSDMSDYESASEGPAPLVITDIDDADSAKNSTKSAKTSKWWSKDDDRVLLTQANLDQPFLATRNILKAWNSTAQAILEVPGFGRSNLDGKKAQHRFLHLVNEHMAFQKSSKYLSGVAQDETGDIVLLDELVTLYNDCLARKANDKAEKSQNKTQGQDTALFIRDQALARLGKRVKRDDADDDAGPPCAKKKFVVEFQTRELELESQRLAFETKKLEIEADQRDKDRAERAAERAQREQKRAFDRAATAEIMQLLRDLVQHR